MRDYDIEWNIFCFVVSDFFSTINWLLQCSVVKHEQMNNLAQISKFGSVLRGGEMAIRHSFISC